jgi:hypothetical protein
MVPGRAPGRWISSTSEDVDSGWTIVKMFQRQADCESEADEMIAEAYGYSGVDLYNGEDNGNVLNARAIWQAENAKCKKSFRKDW